MRFQEISDVTPTEVGSNTGTEIETVLECPIARLRQIALQLHNDGYLKLKNEKGINVYYYEDGTNEYTQQSAILQVVKSNLNRMYPSLFHKPPQEDFNVGPNSIELSFAPRTLSNWLANEQVIDHVLQLLSAYGFVATPLCGMHLWYDYDFFGDNLEELRETMEKFYIFSYTFPEVITKITERPDLTSSLMSDLQNLVGDPFGLNKDAALAQFIREKKKFKAGFELLPGEKAQNLYNVRWGKENIPAAEIRWSASTLDVKVVNYKLLAFANIISYCRDISEQNISLETFRDFTMDNQIVGTKKLQSTFHQTKKQLCELI